MPVEAKDDWTTWKARLSSSRKRREERVATWQENVQARKGAGRTSDATSLRLTTTSGVSVNQDWPLTKAKIAQLYSVTPEVRLSPRLPEFQQAVPIFGRELNDTITEAGVGGTIEEVLADVVNAAGIGGVLVSCETRTEPRKVPLVDPSTVPPELQAQIPTTTVEHPTDICYLAQRVSPTDLLVPDDFTGSNYDKARWLGEDGRMTWPQAQANLGLTDDVKSKVLGQDKRTGVGQSLNADTTSFRDTDVVNYTQLFYWRHYYHADETSFKALQRLVFVEGLDEPVINEPYRAQKRSQNGQLVGVTKNPIRVLTLTYISDDALPPSDSTIVRSQVLELQDSRSDMQLQRKHSIPMKWGDVNRISAGTKSLIEKGEFQGFIWTNGPGDRAVGEVARAAFPPERYELDRIIKDEITEAVQVGSNQAGAFADGKRSASEAKIVQQNFQTRVGQEQDKVTKFFVGIAEVLAGHLALYGTFAIPDELGIQREALATSFTYGVRADSTVRLDAQQRIDQLIRVLNLGAQSPFINPAPIWAEILELSDLDPGKVMIEPKPKAPEPVKVSVSKAEDLDDPLFLALLMRTHQGPAPEDLQAAIALRKSAIEGTAAMTASLLVPGAPSAPTPPVPNPQQIPPMAHPGWEAAPRLDRRAEDGGA